MASGEQTVMDFGLEASKVFTPTAPIDERTLFAGRTEQVREIIDAVNQKGQHAIVFGERGVGKTSLANVLSSFLSHPASTVLSPRVNCDATDTYKSLWVKVFKEIDLTRTTKSAGFVGEPLESRYSAAEHLGEDFGPDDVRRLLQVIAQSSLPIVIIDEFDRLNREVKRALADTIKTLSDHAVAATIVLVGVGDSVDELIEEHRSVERALVQVHMPRMSGKEIRQIITTGLERLNLEIEEAVADRILNLSQGLPHYTHLLALHASRECFDRGLSKINDECLSGAIGKALSKAQQTIRSLYHTATMSSRKEHLFVEVLLACAVAPCDELGYFSAVDVRSPLQKITGKDYQIPSFSQHLKEFCETKRGPVLQKTGERRRFRFRFTDPLLQPFVIMQGFTTGRLRLLDGWS
ncbi:MAG: ATP-binding protein [Acidobacteriota bacterium]|nr:ATP-binding protein [Acidobacteriota bacterium]